MITRKPKPTKAPKVLQLKESWLEKQATHYQNQFDATAKELVWQLTEGGGSKNVHVLDTLRNLQWNYLVCASYRLAARDAELI